MGYLIARKCHSFFTQIIVDVMKLSKNWQVAAKDSNVLEKLCADIVNTINNFYVEIKTVIFSFKRRQKYNNIR